MKTTAKTDKSFDCIEFKQQSQQRLMSEYEKRKDEFGSYIDFIKGKTFEDEWASRLWKSIGTEDSMPLPNRINP